MLRVPLPARDAYTIILRPLHIVADLIDTCHKQMLMYDNITFWQLSVNECVKYKQCLNSLRTTLVHDVCLLYSVHFVVQFGMLLNVFPFLVDSHV